MAEQYRRFAFKNVNELTAFVDGYNKKVEEAIKKGKEEYPEEPQRRDYVKTKAGGTASEADIARRAYGNDAPDSLARSRDRQRDGKIFGGPIYPIPVRRGSQTRRRTTVRRTATHSTRTTWSKRRFMRKSHGRTRSTSGRTKSGKRRSRGST